MVVAALLPFLGGSGLAAQVTTGQPGGPQKRSVNYQYYDLACDVGAWEGYFAAQQWQRTLEPVGEEGKLAGQGVLPLRQQGKTVLVELLTDAQQVWSIEVPTSGYLSFGLVAARDATERSFRIRINDRALPLDRRSDGFCYSPFLKAGDRFSLVMPAGEALYHWKNLLFHSNYKAVIVRPEEVLPSRRFAPIEASLIQRVFFLSDRPGSWPVFDQDGDITTVEDQFELRGDNKRFKVSYFDEIEEKDKVFFLNRTFTIREKCSRGSWLRSRRQWAVLPMIPD